MTATGIAARARREVRALRTDAALAFGPERVPILETPDEAARRTWVREARARRREKVGLMLMDADEPVAGIVDCLRADGADPELIARVEDQSVKMRLSGVRLLDALEDFDEWADAPPDAAPRRMARMTLCARAAFLLAVVLWIAAAAGYALNGSAVFAAVYAALAAVWAGLYLFVSPMWVRSREAARRRRVFG